MIDKEVIGMEKQAAIDLLDSRQVLWRIMSEDGESFMGTCDYKLNRVNLHITDGKVTSTDRG